MGRIDVPSELGAPLAPNGTDRVFSPNSVKSETLAFGPGGLFVLARGASAQTIERYDPATLARPVSIFVGADHWSIAEIVPTAAAMYVVATPVAAAPGSRPALGSPGLYRLVGGRLVLVRTLDGPGILTPVAPFAPGADSEAPIHGGSKGLFTDGPFLLLLWRFGAGDQTAGPGRAC